MTFVDCIHEAIHSGDRGKAQRVASRMGIPYHTLAKYALGCNGDEKPHRLPAELLPSLVIASESFLPLDHIEASVGRVAIVLPDGAGGLSELAGRVCATVREFGDLARVAGESLRDGKVTRREAESMEREGYEVVREIMALIEAVKGAGK